MNRIYPIIEIFDSIQGEGVWTGTPATFIRLAGCNLRCEWCDTKESWNEINNNYMTVEEIMGKINMTHIIITGGEPLIHDLTYLLDALIKNNIIHIETNGTCEWLDSYTSNSNIWVTISPKEVADYKICSSILEEANEFKFVVDEQFNPENVQNFINRNNIDENTIPIYLSPEGVKTEMIRASIKYVMDNPQWKLGMQLHKLINMK